MANETGHQPGRFFVGQDGKANSYGSAGQTCLVDGAITITEGVVVITKATAAALTLAAPVAGVDDFKQLTVLSTTAAAHTVTQTTPGFNSLGTDGDVATFAAAVGNHFSMIAYQGVWYLYGVDVGITVA